MKVRVAGAELHCSTRGSGPACLVISALGTAMYERQIPRALSEHLELAFVDLRGLGESTGDAADLTFDRLAEDLEAVRTALGAPQAVVLGHSILGVLALEYSRRRPETVSHVITVGTPPRGDLTWLTEAARSFFERDASDDRKAILRQNLAALPPNPTFVQGLTAQTPTRFFDPRLDAAPLYAGAIVKPGFLGARERPTDSWDVRAGAASLRAPILLAHGRYDYTVPYEVWDGVVSILPDATFQLFDRSGHQPFWEEPERFVEVVTGWLASRPFGKAGNGARS